VSQAENTANIELKKLSKWAKDNKVRFNDQKSKVKSNAVDTSKKEGKAGFGSIFK
jgi:hypothetical protein